MRHRHVHIGFLKLQVSFRKRATNYRALLRKMTCEDKISMGHSRCHETSPCTPAFWAPFEHSVCVRVWEKAPSHILRSLFSPSHILSHRMCEAAKTFFERWWENVRESEREAQEKECEWLISSKSYAITMYTCDVWDLFICVCVRVVSVRRSIDTLSLQVIFRKRAL